MPDVQDPVEVLALLSSLKTRLSQTSESLREVLETLHCGPQQSHNWDSLLGSAGVLGARLGALEAESAAAAGLLGTLLVHPHTLPQGDPDLLPRVYLRTKLVPDLSAEIEGRVLEHSEPPVHLGISDQSIPSSSASAEAALEAQDRMIQWAQDMLVESLEPLPPTSTSQNTAILNKSSGGFTLTPDSRRKALQSSLSWMSSGTDAST